MFIPAVLRLRFEFYFRKLIPVQQQQPGIFTAAVAVNLAPV